MQREIHASRPILAFALFALGAGLASGDPVRFGVADTRPSPFACATLQGPELTPGERIHVVAFGPPRAVAGVVVGKRAIACDEEALLEGIAYDVELAVPEEVRDELGIAIIAPEATPVVEGGAALVPARDRSEAVVFRRCNGSEGVHFLAWQGPTRLWHEYYYLGYEIEPTCSQEELAKRRR